MPCLCEECEPEVGERLIQDRLDWLWLLDRELAKLARARTRLVGQLVMLVGGAAMPGQSADFQPDDHRQGIYRDVGNAPRKEAIP